jgi:hypothetical protein
MDIQQKFYLDIGYKPYQELRILIDPELNSWYSIYPKCYAHTLEVLNHPDFKDKNIYVGVNPRKSKGQSELDVAYRRMIVFDVEALGKKPPLNNPKYKSKLKEAIIYIRRIVDEYT